MRKHALFSLILLLSFLSGRNAFSQVITDEDKHSFDSLPRLSIDIDGDGKAESIRPRTYSVRESRTTQSRKARTAHWIAFDLLPTSKGTRKTLFRYRYGDDRADYWVWALKSAGDMNADERNDLVFYSGDDTTDETVLLIQESVSFRACSTGVILGDYELDDKLNIWTLEFFDIKAGQKPPRRQIAKWNPDRLRFEGNGLFWIRESNASLRAGPLQLSKSLFKLNKYDAVIASIENGKTVTIEDWIKVETDSGTGWLHRDVLSSNSLLALPE